MLLSLTLHISACSSNNYTNDYMTYDIVYNNLMFDISADIKDYLYIADKETVHVVNEKGKIINNVQFKDYFITNVFIENNVIYALDIFNNKLFKVGNEYKIEKEITVDLNMKEISKIRKLGDFLFILGIEDDTDKSSSKYEFFIYNVSNKEKRLVKNYDIVNFSVYDQNTILLLSRDDFYLSLTKYDYINSTENNCGYIYKEINDFEYDENTNKIFFATDTEIMSANIDNPNICTSIGNIKSNNSITINKIALSNNFIFLLNDGESPIERFYKNNKTENIELVYLTNNGNDTFDKGFENSNPNVSVERRWGNEYAEREKFIVTLMAGESSFDIFELRSNTPFSYNIVKNNIFYDLSISEIISNNIDNMFKAIKDSSYYQGKIFGFPISAGTEVLFYNEDLLLKHNINLNTLTSWDDFITLFKELGQKKNLPYTFFTSNKYRVQQLMIEQYLCNYNDIYKEEINFDTPKFKEILIIMKQNDVLSPLL